MLTDAQIERYSRQIIIPLIGGRGQEKLLAASAAIVGAGELGNTAAVYLAAAGVGRLGVPEPAVASIQALNPDCGGAALGTPRTPAAAMAIAGDHDVVISAGASAETDLAVAAACLTQRKPLVWARAIGSIGQVTTFDGSQPWAPCYRCVRRQLALESYTTAVPALAAVTARFVGCVVAMETIKVVLGVGAPLVGRVLVHDALSAEVREVQVTRDPHCTACGPDGQAPERVVTG
jgi:molybdopterin/thiamine biosynthesis adenylyltransferase